MIITVDPSQSEDIAAFAMVKQYRMQALNVTLNGGTGSSAWQAVQGGEGYTQTVVTPVTGIELVYEDPNAIVSYTVENDDTSNYDTASNAGIILSSIEPTTNAWTYTCVFHADSVPVSSVDIDLLVYGNIARGTEQQGSPATAEEITAQVLAGLETRVLALETEMPTKADVATTYTKAEIDDTVVKLTGPQTIAGEKIHLNGLLGQYVQGSVPATGTHYIEVRYRGVTTQYAKVEIADYINNISSKFLEFYMVWNGGSESYRVVGRYLGEAPSGVKYTKTTEGDILLIVPIGNYHSFFANVTSARSWDNNLAVTITRADNPDYSALVLKDVPMMGIGTYATATTRGYNAGSAYSSDVATIGTLDAYTPMVRTTGNQSISGTKTFTVPIHIDRSSGACTWFRALNLDVTEARTTYQYFQSVIWADKNNVECLRLFPRITQSGRIDLVADVRKPDGTWSFQNMILQGPE